MPPSVSLLCSSSAAYSHQTHCMTSITYKHTHVIRASATILLIKGRKTCHQSMTHMLQEMKTDHEIQQKKAYLTASCTIGRRIW